MDRVFDRVLFARHFALSLGAVAAYVFRTELRIGYVALWIVGISASLNFAAYLFRSRPGLTRICTVASPIIGVGGWTALIGVTNGVASPFISGLWLEIILSAMALQLRGVVIVTASCVAGLWAQQFWIGLGGVFLPMVLQSGFLTGMGSATYLVTRRWTTRQTQMSVERSALGERLDALNRELEDERVVAALGENVARLAHGLKNTVHSLRGFVGLIEPKLEREGGGRAALEGLRAAIDDLESLAHLTLGSGKQADSRGTVPALLGAGGEVDLHAGVAHALSEISASHPGVTWAVHTDGVLAVIPLADASLSETLVILMRNAVEAMDGVGRGTLETRVDRDAFIITVKDEGPGFGATDTDLIFKPGYTTKPEGSGYGLFLAMRLLEEQGGAITARNREGRGAAIEVRLPIAGA
jgi:signal transduction histidine kinase